MSIPRENGDFADLQRKIEADLQRVQDIINASERTLVITNCVVIVAIIVLTFLIARIIW